MSSSLLVNRVNIVDIRNGEILSDKSLLIQDGLIKSISNWLPNSEVGAGKVLEYKKKLWAIPGLIDSHAHILEEPDEDLAKTFRCDEPFEEAFKRAIKNINSALKAGITTIRDVGAYGGRNNIVRDILNKEPSVYKFRLLSCGNHVTVEGGHWSDRGRAWNKKESISKHVQDEIDAGADFIKVMNDEVIFNKDELKEIVETAHRNNVKVACHALSEYAISLALDAKADTIEHAFPISEASIKQILSQGTYLCPTFVAAYDTIYAPNIVEVLSAFPDCSYDEFKEWYNLLIENIPVAFKNEIKVLAGTDAGTLPTPFNSIHREINFLTQLGASNLEALQSATINPAMAFGLEKEIGSLEIGKSADLVLLNKNPLVGNIKEALETIELVISKGFVV
jgi:imidazolonepropionase-like amidohydrolase